MYLNDMMIICYCYFELVIINVDRFVVGWQMVEGLYYQFVNGIYFFIVKVCVEGFVEVFDGGQGVYCSGVVVQLVEIDIFFFVVFVFNFFDDEFKDIFDGYQIRDVVEFVNNDCYMIVL